MFFTDARLYRVFFTKYTWQSEHFALSGNFWHGLPSIQVLTLGKAARCEIWCVPTSFAECRDMDTRQTNGHLVVTGKSPCSIVHGLPSVAPDTRQRRDTWPR